MDYGNAHGNNNNNDQQIHRLYQHHLEKEEQLKQQLRSEYEERLKAANSNDNNLYIVIGIALVIVFGAVILMKYLFIQPQPINNPYNHTATPLVIYSVAPPPMQAAIPLSVHAPQQIPVCFQPFQSNQMQTLYSINPHQIYNP